MNKFKLSKPIPATTLGDKFGKLKIRKKRIVFTKPRPVIDEQARQKQFILI